MHFRDRQLQFVGLDLDRWIAKAVLKFTVLTSFSYKRAIPCLVMTILPSLSALVSAWRNDSISIKGEFN